MRVLQTAIENGLVDQSVVFIDGTHIKANANTKQSAIRKAKGNNRTSFRGRKRKTRTPIHSAQRLSES
jgi:hypothetical protein